MKSIERCQPTVIQGVHLQWPKFYIPKECIEEQFFVPRGCVKMTLHNDFVDHCYEFFRINVGDLLCVRYGYDSHQSVKSVYHFVVHDVKINEQMEQKVEHKENVVFLKSISDMNCRVSENMKNVLESKKNTCEVQLIQLKDSYRYISCFDLINEYWGGQFSYTES